MSEAETVSTYTFTVENVGKPDWAHHSDGFYTIELDIQDIYSEDKDTRGKAKAALAALRKRVKAYRCSRDYRHHFLTWSDFQSRVNGSTWTQHESVILHIADQLVTTEPLENLFKKASDQAKEAYERKQQEYQRRRMTQPSQSTGMSAEKAFAIFSFRDRTLLNVSSEDVKRQYRVLAKQYHPDAGGNAAKFRTLQTAYETLTEFTSPGGCAYSNDFADLCDRIRRAYAAS